MLVPPWQLDPSFGGNLSMLKSVKLTLGTGRVNIPDNEVIIVSSLALASSLILI